MKPHQLQLDVDCYAGPFDLLCNVLLRRELPIGDVDLAEVVVAYLQRLQMSDDFELEGVSEFVLLLASLLEVKARELVHCEDALDVADPEPAPDAAELLDRLIRYAAFQNASRWLIHEGEKPRYWRSSALPAMARKRSYGGISRDPAVLARSIAVLLAEPNVDVRHLVGRHISVRDLVHKLTEVLIERGSYTFEQFVAGWSRLDQAAAFVATLELCKNGHATIHQHEPFGSIEVRHCEPAQQPAPAAAPAAKHATEAAEPVHETEFQIA